MADDHQNRLDRARALASEKIEYISQNAKTAGAKASKKMAGARDKADDALGSASHIVSDHPLAAVAGAVAFGAVIAMVMPRLRRGPKADIKADSGPEADEAGAEHAKDNPQSSGG